MARSPQTRLYGAVAEALHRLGCDIAAAECHGILCGMLCGPGSFDPAVWIRHVTGRDELSVISAGSSEDALWSLLRETVKTLNSEDLSWAPLLPDDDQPLIDRAAALGAWCRGFLGGFGLSRCDDRVQLSSDCRGFLNDLCDIGRVDADRAKGENDEQALFELSEYIRIGALLLREETRFIAAGADAPKSVH